MLIEICFDNKCYHIYKSIFNFAKRRTLFGEAQIENHHNGRGATLKQNHFEKRQNRQRSAIFVWSLEGENKRKGETFQT